MGPTGTAKDPVNAGPGQDSEAPAAYRERVAVLRRTDYDAACRLGRWRGRRRGAATAGVV